jgi:hypothetical protein
MVDHGVELPAVNQVSLYMEMKILKVTYHSYGWAPVRARIGLQPVGAVLYVCSLFIK